MKLISVCVFTAILGCAAPLQAGIAPADAAEIIDTLLDLEQPKFHHRDAQGRDGYDALGAYKSWGALYEKYAQLRHEAGVFQAGYLRVYLLLGRIALEKTDAATMEAFDTDLMTIYQLHREPVLQALKELPFLIPSTCRYLNRYFGFEGRNREAKPKFLLANEAVIRRALAPADAELCLSFFTD